VNLHRRFFGEFPEVKRPDKSRRIFRVTRPGQPTVEVDMVQVETTLRLRADDMCRGKATPF